MLRSPLSRRSAACAIAVAVLTIAASAQMPLAPVRESGQGVTPAFEGWYQNKDGSFSILVGYFNRNSKETLDIPAGPNNRIEPGGPDQGQPTHFMTRRQWGVFTIKVPKDFGDKRLTWTIVANGQTNSIPVGVIKGYQVEPFLEAAQKNEPPRLQFDPKGEAFYGPPVGIAATFTGAVGQPVAILGHRDRWRGERPRPVAGSDEAATGERLAQQVSGPGRDHVQRSEAEAREGWPLHDQRHVLSAWRVHRPGPGERPIGRGRRRIPVLLDEHPRESDDHGRDNQVSWQIGQVRRVRRVGHDPTSPTGLTRPTSRKRHRK